MPDLPTILARLAVLEQRVADLEAAALPTPPATDCPGTVLRAREACHRAGWTYSWAVRHWRELGGFKDMDGRLKIRAELLARGQEGVK
jgi:hypothetical protein